MTATQSIALNRQQSARGEASAPIALEAAYALGRSTWTAIVLSYERFHAHATRLASAFSVAPAHAGDLYLCAACANGESAAYQALEATYFPALERIVGRMLGERAATEEVLQEIRTRLFVGSAPRICSYRGSGPLAGWLRSLAVNAAQDRLRSNNVQRGRLRRLASAQRMNLATTTEESDQAFRSDYTRVCGRAWGAAIGSLRAEERQLLHHYFVSGLSIDVLGPLYHVHRATVHRRIRRATEQVRRQVRETLTRHYWGLSHRDLDALALRACCDLDLTAGLGRDAVDPSRAA